MISEERKELLHQLTLFNTNIQEVKELVHYADSIKSYMDKLYFTLSILDEKRFSENDYILYKHYINSIINFFNNEIRELQLLKPKIDISQLTIDDLFNL